MGPVGVTQVYKDSGMNSDDKVVFQEAERKWEIFDIIFYKQD